MRVAIIATVLNRHPEETPTMSLDDAADGKAAETHPWRAKLLVASLAILVIVGVTRLFIWPASDVEAQARPDQFDLRNLTIHRNEIRRGGPPKDGIPAISRPQTIAADKATLMQPGERVIGVRVGDQARAYPLRILAQHEIINDQLEGEPIAVTYCPLCDSSLVFSRQLAGREVEFGVSGLLYNSNVLMYDRNPDGPEKLWSQMMTQSVSGANAGDGISTRPFEVTTWSDWSARYPQSDVMSFDTGHVRNYSVNPYEPYFKTQMLFFPVRPVAPTDRLAPKTPVLGIWNKSGARAYPITAFGKSQTVAESLGETTFQVVYAADSKHVRLEHVDGELNVAYAFWFAWYAFHPQTSLFEDTLDNLSE